MPKNYVAISEPVFKALGAAADDAASTMSGLYQGRLMKHIEKVRNSGRVVSNAAFDAMYSMDNNTAREKLDGVEQAKATKEAKAAKKETKAATEASIYYNYLRGRTGTDDHLSGSSTQLDYAVARAIGERDAANDHRLRTKAEVVKEVKRLLEE